jgi:hypothetical protein
LLQGRFEQVNDSPYGTVMASMLTAVAARDNVSSTVEVRGSSYLGINKVIRLTSYQSVKGRTKEN